MLTYEQIAQEFDRLLKALQQIILSVLTRLGVFGVAFMPAAFTGYSVYVIFERTEAGAWFGILTAFALEVAGILGIHTASDLYTGQSKGRFYLMLALLPVYILAIIGIVYFSDGAFHPLVRSIGMASPFLTGVTYVAIALRGKNEAEQAQAVKEEAEIKARKEKAEQEERQHQLEVEAQERAWRQERERLELELKHQEKMARIEAKKNTKLPRNILAKGRISKADKRELSLNILREFPTISGAELGRQLGATERTGQNILNELEQAGIIHRNGDGWRVK